MYKHFTAHELSEGHCFYTGELPARLLQNLPFAEIWNLHPADYHVIMMHGKEVLTPRWQQAYGRNYAYTGRVNAALPVPEILEKLHVWVKENIDERLNGLLLNWYDGQKGHYIGKHRDSTKNMIAGAPIVTVSLGDFRAFRLRPYGGKGFRDFGAENGAVFVMPYAVNQAFTHEVPATKKYTGRRISVTFRAFESVELLSC